MTESVAQSTLVTNVVARRASRVLSVSAGLAITLTRRSTFFWEAAGTSPAPSEPAEVGIAAVGAAITAKSDAKCSRNVYISTTFYFIEVA